MKSKNDIPYVRLQITEDAKNALERQSARHGMSQTEMASRLVMWLVGQPQTVQAAILNKINGDLGEELATSLRAAAMGATRPAARRTTKRPRQK